MAKKSMDSRIYNISVVGLSGTEREKGVNGVGKSCLCNRFVRPLADDYHTDHISVLSQSDFGSRVINNDHFLYWGDVTKTDDGNDYTFHVIEQTEFMDDVSFQPFKSGRIEPYLKRCINTKLHSAEKLMYICKEQLGVETDSSYVQKIVPEGRLTMDGFICLFDVSSVQQRPHDRQTEFIVMLLVNAIRTKKPVVLVTTKNDEADEKHVQEAEKIVNRKEFKGTHIPLVETSSHENVNVELAFMTLAHLIDKLKSKPKIIPFSEASRDRKEILNVATEAYLQMLRMTISDPKAVWPAWKRSFEKKPDYEHYKDLFGRDTARKRFRMHIRQLREDQMRKRETHFLSQLPDILQHFLPSLDVISDRSWPSCQRYIQRHGDFDLYFVDVATDGGSWKETDFVDNYEETRIPFDLLRVTEAEMYFRNHLNALQAEYRKVELKRQFRQLLEESAHVMPGKPMSEAYVFFVGKECYNSLQEHERMQVYEQYQQELKILCHADFQELLWENIEMFSALRAEGRLTQDDLREITDTLQEDARYKRLHRLEEDRKVMLLNHLVSAQEPAKARCCFRDACSDVQIRKLLANTESRSCLTEQYNLSTCPEEIHINLVLLGRDNLTLELNTEIRQLYPADEFILDDTLYTLDYRIIDGDVTLQMNSFATPTFQPHGCFCVFSTFDQLDYIESSLQSAVSRDMSLQSLPVILIHALNTLLSEENQDILRNQAAQVALSLSCTVVEIPLDQTYMEGMVVHPTQVNCALQVMIAQLGKSTPTPDSPQYGLDDLDAPVDLRFAFCLMCGESYSIDLPLGPVLNCGLYRHISDDHASLILDTYLETGRRRLQTYFLSYHSAIVMQAETMFHGYVLVYSAERKASLAVLRAFVSTLPADVPILILVVVSHGDVARFFSSEHVQGLVLEGHLLAEELRAKFITTTANFQHQTAVYMPFFKEAWERKGMTDFRHRKGLVEAGLEHPMDRRPQLPIPPPPPPAPPPGQSNADPYATTKSSTSNSQSTDSEPLYDHPGRYQSDSEYDRPSSPSPPPTGIYSQAQQPQQQRQSSDSIDKSSGVSVENLVRPSQLKQRRDMYAEQSRDRYRKSYPCANSLVTKLTGAADISSSSPYHSLTVFPQFTFRKSSSMKLEVKDAQVEWAWNSQYENPSSIPPSRPGAEEWIENTLYESLSQVRVSGDKAKSKHKDKSNDKVPACMVDSRGFVQAPLAQPEQIEIADYAMVMDAVPENDYALVQDALPAGHVHRITSVHNKDAKAVTDSDSEFSSLERNKKPRDIYSRVNRKPTPHKKKSKSRSQEGHSQDRNERDRIKGSFDDHIIKVGSNSPSEGSEGTGDELLQGRKDKKKRSSFRSRRWKSTTTAPPEHSQSPHLSDSDYVGSPPGKANEGYEEENLYEAVVPRDLPSSNRYGGGMASSEDLDAAGVDTVEATFTRPKSGSTKMLIRDPDKNKKKEEKKAKEEERRRLKEIKEEEKRRLKEDTVRKKLRKKDGKLGGISQSGYILEDHIPSMDNHSVPLFVEKCIIYIEEEGLAVEGIYRVPGNKAQVDLLLQKFHEDPGVDILLLDIQVNAVATALKSFFSELFEPLVPSYLYEEFFEAARIPEKSCRLVALRGVLKKLPQSNYQVLKYLSSHLTRVSKNSQVNSMDCRNLAVCWWPTLIRPNIASLEKMSEVSNICVEIVLMLIEQSGFFFYGLDEV